MGLPSQKRTKSSAKRRASHFALKKAVLNTCSKCQKPVAPHKACDFCGTYKGRQVIEIKTKAKTLKQKEQARKTATKEKAATKKKKATK